MSISEKTSAGPFEPLLAVRSSHQGNEVNRQQQTRVRRVIVCICAFFALAWLLSNRTIIDTVPRRHGKPASDGSCHQVPPLAPQHHTLELGKMDAYIQSEAFRNASIVRLSKAVQIPTESFDDMGSIGEDDRWDIMYKFATYLEGTFPQTHKVLKLEKVNTHGLLYTWTGTNSSLKPTLLMAHQDVVPVPKSTVNTWTHPPFSGFYDGEFIWGRGSSDCKNQLIGTLEAVEELVNAGFQPRRTIILSFGFDEEISGWNGAAYLSKFLLERYGHHKIAAIVDEGSGFDSQWGSKIAIPGVGEKGYTDVSITVNMPGGHSSIPPDHTGIGVISELISLVEADQYPTNLADSNPFFKLLQCGAEYSPNFPAKLKKLIKKRLHHRTCNAKKDKLALEVAKIGPQARYLMQTSIAVDIISGGVKINALPERTTAMVNHRVNIGEHTSSVHTKIAGLAKKVAKKHGLTLHAYDNQTDASNSIVLSHIDRPLEPAPVTPTQTDRISPWSILSGTIRKLYGEELIVAPGIMTGNTDTRHYWDLSEHIFRFSPGWDGKTLGFGKIHTVDERMSVEMHVNTVRWISLFIRNMDEGELE